jgi:phage terminase large subunit
MDKEFKVLDAYAPLFHSDKTYYLISGGRGSGKSTQAAAYFLIKLMGNEFFRGVVARYTQKSIKSSIYRDILDLAESWGIKPYIRIDGDEITNRFNGNMILTHAMKLADGTMQAKGKGLAKVTHLLIDEATELPSEEEFIKLNDSFRTKDVERKIFILFNPTTKRHWIHNRWYQDGRPNPKWAVDHEFIHTTYHINSHNLDPKKIAEWERMKDIDMEYYNHHILGMWQDGVVGRIFTGWEVGEAPEGIDTIYGLDFGFASDPAALVKVSKHNGKLYLEQKIYEQGLTNEDIHQRMQRLGIPRNAQIIADSAEPKSIEELRRKGWNIQPAYKGPDSIRNGIDKIKQHQVFVHPASDDLRKEYELYCWKADTDKPIDAWNHALDAVRYALSKEKNAQYAFYRKGKDKFMPD